MKIQYKSLLASVDKLPPGVCSIECTQTHVLLVFSGDLSINGRKVQNTIPTILPSGRIYLLETRCATMLAVIKIPKITSFQVGDFRIGV